MSALHHPASGTGSGVKSGPLESGVILEDGVEGGSAEKAIMQHLTGDASDNNGLSLPVCQMHGVNCVGLKPPEEEDGVLESEGVKSGSREPVAYHSCVHVNDGVKIRLPQSQTTGVDGMKTGLLETASDGVF